MREEKNQLGENLAAAREQIPAMEGQLKRLKIKFDEEIRASRRMLNQGEKKERIKDEQHRERVRELREKLGIVEI